LIFVCWFCTLKLSWICLLALLAFSEIFVIFLYVRLCHLWKKEFYFFHSNLDVFCSTSFMLVVMFSLSFECYHFLKITLSEDLSILCPFQKSQLLLSVILYCFVSYFLSIWIFITSVLHLAFSLVCSSFSSSLRSKVRLFIWDLFLNIAVYYY
jgi:hypothetical protein